MIKAKKSKHFSYNLKAVLKVRTIQEKQEQDKYAEAQRILEEEIKKEKALIEQQTLCYMELRELMMGDVSKNMSSITSRKYFLDKLKVDIENQIQKRKEAEEKKEAQRLKLIEAMKAKKIIEKDKEKKKIAWKKLMDKEDSKFLDDIATVGFDRKKRKTEDETD
jgi:flagellar FliJ protein